MEANHSHKTPEDWLEGIEGAVFDLDGTLIDSMPYWETLSRDYLTRQGITWFPEGFEQTLSIMTVKEAADWFCSLYGLDLSAAEIEAGLNAVMEDHYLHDVALKPGVRALLDQLQHRGLPMVVATATDQHLAQRVLDRLGILSCFQEVLSCEQLHTSKNQPDIFLTAAQVLQSAPDKTLVFEDAPHCIQTAAAAGFPVAAVLDPSAQDQGSLIRKLAQYTVNLDHQDIQVERTSAMETETNAIKK